MNEGFASFGLYVYFTGSIDLTFVAERYLNISCAIIQGVNKGRSGYIGSISECPSQLVDTPMFVQRKKDSKQKEEKNRPFIASKS